MEQIRPLTYLAGYHANCYLVWSGHEAALIDPTASPDTVTAALAEQGLTLRYLLLTHAHYDHLITLYDPNAFAGLPVHIHGADALSLSSTRSLVAHVFGVSTPPPPRPIISLADGDTLPLGDTVLTVHHTPGHTPGSVCYSLGSHWLTGDTLFADSVGATRFPGGDGAVLHDSLCRILKASPTHIYPGHGETAEMCAVRRDNPYLKFL